MGLRTSEATPSGSPHPGNWPIALGLAAMGFALYARILGHSFLHYDDNVYLTENPIVLAGLTWRGIVWAFTSPDAWYGFPLDWISHMAAVQVFGKAPWGHHLVNALLHAANGAVLYLALSRLTGKSTRSALVAALFLLHPVNAETVAWVSERKELLSALFGFLSLIAYVRYLESRTSWRHAVLLLSCAASLLSKPMWVTLPFLLLVLDYWPLHRPEPLRTRVTEKWALFVLSAGASLLAILAQSSGGALRGAELPPLARLANASVSCVTYLRNLAWPAWLSPYYPHLGPNPPWGRAVFATGVVALLTVIAVRLRETAPWVTTGWLWFLGMLVPVAGLIKAGAHGMADRYMYVPAVGIFLLVVWTLAGLAQRTGTTWIASVGAALLLAAMASVAWKQAGFWSDQVTLFRRALSVTDGNAVAHLALSQGLAIEGKWPEALQHAQEAARLSPGEARVRKNLGYMLFRSGRVDESIEEFRAAIAIEPDYAEAHGNLAIALGRKGQWAESAREFAEERRLRSRLR